MTHLLYEVSTYMERHNLACAALLALSTYSLIFHTSFVRYIRTVFTSADLSLARAREAISYAYEGSQLHRDVYIIDTCPPAVLVQDYAVSRESTALLG